MTKKQEKLHFFKLQEEVPVIDPITKEIVNYETLIRDITVVDGIPFYKSSGTSEGQMQNIRPELRADTWVPFLGFAEIDEPERSIKFSMLVKHSHILKGEKDPLIKEFLNQIEKEVIRKNYDQETLFKIISDSLLKESIAKAYEKEHAIGINEGIEQFKEDLISRFGNIPNMILSIHLSKKDPNCFWNKHPYGQDIKKFLEIKYDVYFEKIPDYKIMEDKSILIDYGRDPKKKHQRI